MPGTLPSRGNILYSFMIAPSLTPTALTASTTTAESFTVPGLNVGDAIEVNSNAAQTAGVGIGNARVTAASTLEILFTNCTAGTPTPVAGLYTIVVSRPEIGGGTLPTNAV